MEKENNELLSAVKSGVMNAQNLEEAQRYIQIGLASNLVGGLDLLAKNVKAVSDIQQKLTNKLIEKLEVDIESMEKDEIIESLESINKIVINSLEVQRKVAQGKSLLSEYPSLNEEEKNVVKLLKNLETPEDKKLFLDTLKSVLNKKSVQDDFEDELPK
jgi:F0F1-type ATP synthase epsilon subunit